MSTPSDSPRSVKMLSSKLSFSNLSTKSGDTSRRGAATPTQRSRKQSFNSPSRSLRHQDAAFNAPKVADGNTIAQLYAVFGLPKDPVVWTLAEEDCVSGVHHIEGAVGRFWRPEVLGCSICPPVTEQALDNVASPRPPSSASKRKEETKWGSDGKKASNPKFIEMADGRGGIERAETARVLSKALKLSFTREIEVASGPGNFPPASSSHTFSFSVPTIKSSAPSVARPSADMRKGSTTLGVSAADVHKTNDSATGEGFGLEGVQGRATGMMGNAGEETSSVATFYGAVLTVWSAADDKRSKAIKKELDRAAKARAGGRNGKVGNDGEDVENNEDEFESQANQGYSFLPENNAFFMPYAICIVSRYPIYNLLGDWNKAAWHKYSRNIEMHNKLMAAILRHPAPRLGETFKIQSPDDDLTFICTFPGALDWGRGLLGINFMMWPLFKTLSLDNILTICEIALAPAGRVLFLSRHPALLGMAVETIKYLIEMCGWRGVAHQNCHARDVKIYLEDPGSWLIAINTELRSIAKPAKEVCVVDLDINSVNCPRPPLKAPSTRSVRDKKRRKLVNALGFSSADYAPPREFVDAFPASRFRPLCKVQSKSGAAAPYESLEPPRWWEQGSIVTAFDQVLHEGTRPSFLKKVLKLRTERQVTSETELAAVLALRRRASTFVDARDGLENKIGRLNKRLAFLMSEGETWRQQFDKIQQLVDRLTREANELRGKVDKERRESRRLSTTLQQRDLEHVQLQLQLRDTEQAREKANTELARMRDAMDTLEHEREAMMDEIRNVVSSGLEDFDFDSLSKLEMMADGGTRMFRSQSPSSSASHNSELAILKSRALAEQRISMGRPRTESALRKGSSRAGSRHGHAVSQNGHAEETAKSGSVQNHFPDEQMNFEIQSRTSAVTDQITRIQQQLESTLTHLEGRRSGTFERERERRRMSNSSMNSAYRYEHVGPPSSLGHYGGGGSVSGHGRDFSHDTNGSEPAHEAVESIQDHNDSSELRSNGTPRRLPPPSSFRAPNAGSSATRQSTPGKNQAAAPALLPKNPNRTRLSASNSSSNHEQTSPTISDNENVGQLPRSVENGSSMEAHAHNEPEADEKVVSAKSEQVESVDEAPAATADAKQAEVAEPKAKAKEASTDAKEESLQEEPVEAAEDEATGTAQAERVKDDVEGSDAVAKDADKAENVKADEATSIKAPEDESVVSDKALPTEDPEDTTSISEAKSISEEKDGKLVSEEKDAKSESAADKEDTEAQAVSDEKDADQADGASHSKVTSTLAAVTTTGAAAVVAGVTLLASGKDEETKAAEEPASEQAEESPDASASTAGKEAPSGEVAAADEAQANHDTASATPTADDHKADKEEDVDSEADAKVDDKDSEPRMREDNQDVPEDASSEEEFDMFAEPEDFRPKTPPPTVTYYDFPGNEAKVTLNLVGSHPLWGHLAWNSSFIMSDFICAHANSLTKGKKVLELGAAAGLPSIVCNWAEASKVVATDYPDPDLIENLTKNVETNCGKDGESPYKGPGDAVVEGYIWGTDETKLLSHLSPSGVEKFDVILMSDLVFNHQAHPALLDTCDRCLSEAPTEATSEDGEMRTPCVLVFFTHHRPHLAYKDMGFFDMAEVKGWKHEKLGEWFREPMFPDDPGDEQVRSTIHGFRLWRGGNEDLE